MVSINQIKELRSLTGAGIADCKKALEVNDGDIKKSRLWLQAKGIEKASENAGRETGQGLIVMELSDDNKSCFAVEVNSETDFLSDGEMFQELCQAIAVHARDLGSDLESKIVETSEQDVQDMRLRSKENIKLGRVTYLESSNGVVGAYLHSRVRSNNCGKICGLVVLEAEKETSAVKDLAKSLAMQIVAQNPQYLKLSEVDEDAVNSMKEIYTKEAEDTGKPQEIVVTIVKNKVDKYLEQIVLEEQIYIMDDTKKIKQLVDEVSKLDGQSIKIKKYVRLEIGR